MVKIEVFTSPQCSYCERAKALLERKGLDYENRDVAEPGHREELLRRLPRVRAVPQIFVGGEHVGGFEDLEILERDGRLDIMTGG